MRLKSQIPDLIVSELFLNLRLIDLKINLIFDLDKKLDTFI